MRSFAVVLCVLLSALLSGAALSQEKLAVVAGVRPQATGALGDSKITLVRGSDLREGETVITGNNGEVQVVFSDETHLVIGRGSSLIIERYLMRNDGTAQKFAVNALAGTFRFITGKGDKDAYSIATPTGTLGVRGTEFDFTVDGSTGLTSVILFEGGVELCPTRGECVALTQRCEIAQLMTRREAKLLSRESDRLKVARTAFPYVASQARLLREFRVDRPARCSSPVTITPEAKETVVAVIVPPPPKPEPPKPPKPPKPDDPKPHKEHHGHGKGHDKHDHDGHHGDDGDRGDDDDDDDHRDDDDGDRDGGGGHGGYGKGGKHK